ncbi:MAG TPA: hypothetical protein VIY72_16245 [Acidimicrobiales bacterium]
MGGDPTHPAVLAAPTRRALDAPRTRAFVRAWGPTAAAALVCVVAVLVWRPAFYGDRHPVVDHIAYTEQAEQLLDGNLTLPDDADAPEGAVRLTAPGDDGRLFKYVPGTAAVGAASLWLTGGDGLARVGALVLLVVATAGVAAVLGWSPWRRALAAVLVGASPLVLSIDAVLLSYVPAVALSMAALWLVLLATVRESSVRRTLVLLVGAGLVLGAAFLVRQIEVLAWLVVLCGWCALRAGPAPTRRVVQVGAVLAGTVPGLVVLLLFNRAVTGDAFTLPFTVVSPDDGLGWGLRRVLPDDALETFRLVDGIRTTPRATLDLLMWTIAGPALAVGAVVALWTQRRDPTRWLLAALAAAVPLAFLFHWANAHAVWAGFYMGAGPFYYLACVPPLVLLGIEGLARLPRNAVVAGVAVVLVVQTAFLADHLQDWRNGTDQAVAIVEAP